MKFIYFAEAPATCRRENPLKRPPLQTQAVTFLAAHVNALYQAKAQIHTDSRRAPRAEEGESYAHSGQHGQAHANVGNGLQRNDAKIAKADIFAQVIPRGVGHVERFQHKQKKQQQNQRAAYKPQFLSRHREDIVALLEGDNPVRHPAAVEQPLTSELSASNGNAPLVLLVPIIHLHTK